jgi:2'-5' RNA ligase
MKVLVLEIDDPRIRDLLDEVRARVHAGKVPKSPHVTIRGPYSNDISAKVVHNAESKLKDDGGIRVVGVSRFSNAKEDVVYLSLDGEKLREVWWKPDFPIQRFGFNPHVTVYRGDPEEADDVEQWLKKQDVSGPIASWHLSTDSIGQKSLLKE